jgi:hypothetical protein
MLAPPRFYFLEDGEDLCDVADNAKSGDRFVYINSGLVYILIAKEKDFFYQFILMNHPE